MELVVVCILSFSTKEGIYSTCKGMQHQIPTTYWRFTRVSNLPVWFWLHKCDPNSVAGDDRSTLHRNDVLHSMTSLFSVVYFSMLPELCRLQRAEWEEDKWMTISSRSTFCSAFSDTKHAAWHSLWSMNSFHALRTKNTQKCSIKQWNVNLLVCNKHIEQTIFSEIRKTVFSCTGTNVTNYELCSFC